MNLLRIANNSSTTPPPPTPPKFYSTLFSDDLTQIDSKPAILSIDAGGVRGAIPGRILQEIEERSHYPAVELFDFFPGVSTGALVTAGLLVPHLDYPGNRHPALSAEELTNLIRKKSPEVFSRNFQQDISTGYGHLKAKYDPKGLENAIEEIAKKTLMSDLLGEFWCPACDSTKLEPFYFSREASRSETKWSDLLVKDVLRATTAAPSYFPAKTMKIDNATYHFIDGAFASYNPTTWGIALAQKKFDTRHAMILSLGTGSIAYSLADNQDWGKFKWIPWLLDASFATSCKSTEDQVKFLISDDSVYKRIQFDITAEHGQLDDASDGNFAYLKEQTELWIETHTEELNQLTEQLTKNKGLL